MIKVICIDDVTDILNFGDGIKELTYGKEYQILQYYYVEIDRPQQVMILNDRGIYNDYRLSRFVSLEEYRDIKLNKLLRDV